MPPSSRARPTASRPTLRSLAAGALASALLPLSSVTLAQPSPRGSTPTPTSPPPVERNVPCAGCLWQRPADPSRPAPLLVLLHGDEGNPSVVMPRWARASRDRGYAVLALQCPRALGCSSGSWWRWAGDPAWLSQQVDAVAMLHPIDRTRVVLAGWSGGASYLGLVAPRLRGFTGLMLAGGGLPPSEPSCPPCSPPVFFLVGNRNPLHELAVASRDAFATCQAPLRWELLPGKDHGGELTALDATHTRDALQWLEDQARCGPSSPPPAPASAAPSASAAASPPPDPAPVSSAPPSPPGVAPSARPGAGCGCRVGCPEVPYDPRPSAALLLAAWRRARRRRKMAPRRGSPLGAP